MKVNIIWLFLVGALGLIFGIVAAYGLFLVAFGLI